MAGNPGHPHALATIPPDLHHLRMGRQQDTHNRLRREALGAEIARLRKEAGMSTQQHLATVSRVGVRTISKLETGVTPVRVGLMRSIENALSLPTGSTDQFMAGRIDRLEPKGTSTSSDEGPYRIRPRDEVEREMVKIKESQEVIWDYIVARRERLRDEALEKDRRMGRSG